MDVNKSPRKKIRSPVLETTPNSKTSITCTNVPEGLFDAAAAKKHFSKFGRVQKIRLFRKKLMCIVEYEQPSSVERAVLNAGAYDGFMFDVVRTKPRVRRRSSKKDDDPDWLPDSDVEEELSAMSGTPVYRVPRQKPMEIEREKSQIKSIKRVVKNSPIVGKAYLQDKSKSSPIVGTAYFQEKKPISQSASGIESPVIITTAHTSMSTAEAAVELNQLRNRVSLTPDEQWRTLDARDRILRAWGGAGSRVKVGGATIGTCPDMCPEKELLHRQAEHQVMTLETVPESDGQLEPRRAVKQYSRSSADQEIPMCYELRPAPVLMRTCAYLLNEVADTKRQVTLADWFHFMWDRLRGIRKDITQQALCCSESICLVEMCARFHAHCAARLADLEYSQFDQKLNTDNLTKCLQTLKHMYGDVGQEEKPHEAEFRGYIALLNLGDANFLWEIKQLPQEVQKAEPITFAIQIFNALDNNNYVRFFRLVRDKATYLQACILLRYFNDVRARALARIVKAYSPRGGSRYPAEEIMNSLAFESIETMKSFINHYGLRIARDESEISVILDRNQFIEDMDPFPIARAVHLIESKRLCTVGQVIAGGPLPSYNSNYSPYSSFTKDGKLKEEALVAEDQGYNTVNDSNKNVVSLKEEIQKLSQGSSRYYRSTETNNVKPDTLNVSPGKFSNAFVAPVIIASENKGFSFKPAIPVAPFEVINNSPEKILHPEKVFSFSKPNLSTNVIVGKDPEKTSYKSNQDNNFFSKLINENADPTFNSLNIFKNTAERIETKSGEPKSLFENNANKNLFLKKDGDTVVSTAAKHVFRKNSDLNTAKSIGCIFASGVLSQETEPSPQNIFGTFNKTTSMANNIFTRVEKPENINSVFPINGDASKKLSPGSLFKSANSIENKGYSIFQTKNKPSSVAENIFNSVNAPNNAVYDFSENDESQDANNKLLQTEEERKLQEEQERKLRERIEEKKKQELRHIEKQKEEEERRQELERKRQEEIKRREEIRKQEVKRQEELKKKLEAEKKEAELKRKAEEERKFKERVELESSELCSELIDEVRSETVKEILLEEVENMKNLTAYAENVTEEIWTELSDEISASEMNAEKFWTDKLMKKWFDVWRKQLLKNSKRRNLLEDTPVWITEKTPVQEAAHLKRVAESAALKSMNDFHRGYIFTGELPKLPSPEPYNIMEIIKSSLLKRMKQIHYPYDKCFFWKITLVSPSSKWMCRRIELEKWILDVFSDKQHHDTSETLIHVGKQSWNNLMDFAISISLLSQDSTKKNYTEEAVEGSNGLLFYVTENDDTIVKTIEETLIHKYPYQKVPVAIVMPRMKNKCMQTTIEQALHHVRNENIISDFKIFVVEPENVFNSINICTKAAMKWLAKKYPSIPPLEVDYLKSICARYLGSEIWSRFKSEKDCRMSIILKDLPRLVRCYNTAVEKLAHAITNEEVFNYSSFPLEFKQYLCKNSPYPKPYEFIPASARNSNNISVIKDTLNKLKLPDPTTAFQPMSVVGMQDEIQKYCSQIGWFDDPERVICKIVAVLPNQFSNLDMPSEDFTAYFEHYDLAGILNKIVSEKINRLNNFENCYVVYEKTILEQFRDMHWLYDVEVLKTMKHKILQYEDDLDMLIEAKRRKTELDSMEYLMIEENDCTMFEENLKASDVTITKYSNCNQAVKQLEEQIEKESKKSRDFEKLLKAALSNVN